jgi:hypothetical protein
MYCEWEEAEEGDTGKTEDARVKCAAVPVPPTALAAVQISLSLNLGYGSSNEGGRGIRRHNVECEVDEQG